MVRQKHWELMWGQLHLLYSGEFLNNVGGEFELCVNTISQASACVTSQNIEITAEVSRWSS